MASKKSTLSTFNNFYLIDFPLSIAVFQQLWVYHPKFIGPVYVGLKSQFRIGYRRLNNLVEAIAAKAEYLVVKSSEVNIAG
jgi:hypothetical protein